MLIISGERNNLYIFQYWYGIFAVLDLIKKLIPQHVHSVKIFRLSHHAYYIYQQKEYFFYNWYGIFAGFISEQKNWSHNMYTYYQRKDKIFKSSHHECFKLSTPSSHLNYFNTVAQNSNHTCNDILLRCESIRPHMLQMQTISITLICSDHAFKQCV